MKQIPLSQGKYAIVDDKDFEALSQFRWYAQAVFRSANLFYAARAIRTPDGKYTQQRMHRVIVSADRGQNVDHKDRNGLNNQRSNLRIASQRQNRLNSSLRKDNKSGFKGVYASGIKWRMAITIDGRRVFKTFDTAIEAARAYDELAVVGHGEFAVLNFPANSESAA